MIVEFNYSKKPSIATLRAVLRKALTAGARTVEITWGENQITIEQTPAGLFGRGWIGRAGGQDLAAELTKGGHA